MSSHDYTPEPDDEALSLTQLKWKQKYRREQKRSRALEAMLHETMTELANYRKVFLELSRTEGIREKINSLVN